MISRLPVILFAALLAPGPAVAHVGAHAPTPARTDTEHRHGAAVVFPDSPAGRLARDYVRAFNAGETEMTTFLRSNVSAAGLAERPIQARIGRYQGIKEGLGRLEPESITSSTPTECVFTARAAEGRVEVTVAAEPGAPHKLAGVRIEQMDGRGGPEAQAGQSVHGPRMTVAALRESLDRFVDARLADQSFSGTILLMRGDQPVYSRAVGLADRGRAIPVAMDTKFNLGSINKAFTAVAIGQLLEQGKLQLDDTISKLLPDNPVPAAKEVTIDQLVQHRSGLGDFFGDRYDAVDKSKLRTPKDFLPLFADRPLEFAPGTRERYSNAGYVLLGLVVERLSGEAYHDYVRRHVYAPAGMKDTDSYPNDRATRNLAIGYSRRLNASETDTTLRDHLPSLPYRGSPAGGGYSTAGDLARFAAAVRDHKLLGPGWTQWLLGDGPPTGAVVASSGPARGGWGVAGGSPGTNALLEMELGGLRDHALVILANMDPPIAEHMGKAIRRWVANTDF